MDASLLLENPVIITENLGIAKCFPRYLVALPTKQTWEQNHRMSHLTVCKEVIMLLGGPSLLHRKWGGPASELIALRVRIQPRRKKS